MSIGRIGTRAAFVGLGVLTSLALMAAPSLAAKGGNSANAKLCEPGGYPGVLFNQHGETFKNEGKCTSYAAKGGQLVGVNAVAGPVVAGSFTESCSGFGLKPGGFVECGTSWVGELQTETGQVKANGTWSQSVSFPCEIVAGAKIVSLLASATTADGTLLFQLAFPPPSGC